MPESRQLRRSQLFKEVERRRRLLSAMKIAQNHGTASIRERVVARMKEISDELGRLEAELHELNVEQIREELEGS